MFYLSALALLLGAAGLAPERPEPDEPLVLAQLVIREQIIVRVPVRRGGDVAARPDAVEWQEKGGPDCVTARSIVGASLANQNSVDLLLHDGQRLRARLENSCPALDYYYGFYIRPGGDGRICADRDVIRSRVGGNCEIDSFKRLKAKAGR